MLLISSPLIWLWNSYLNMEIKKMENLVEEDDRTAMDERQRVEVPGIAERELFSKVSDRFIKTNYIHFNLIIIWLNYKFNEFFNFCKPVKFSL